MKRQYSWKKWDYRLGGILPSSMSPADLSSMLTRSGKVSEAPIAFGELEDGTKVGLQDLRRKPQRCVMVYTSMPDGRACYGSIYGVPWNGSLNPAYHARKIRELAVSREERFLASVAASEAEEDETRVRQGFAR